MLLASMKGEKMRKIQLAAGSSHMDYGHINDHFAEATAAGADRIHWDASDMTSIPVEPLMGGGSRIMESFRSATDLPIEVHAHVLGATKAWMDQLADVGVNMVILPALHYLHDGGLFRACHDRGMKFGLTINTGVPLWFADEAIYWIDRLHIHTHNPVPINGYRGALRETALPMIRKARQMIEEKNPSCELCADGGITTENLHLCIEAGADVLVMGRQIFGAPDGITSAIKRIRKAIDEATGALEH
jgi:ribulose-phosphate 3-epimerase